MRIESERLRLLALTARQLQLWVENTPALEDELGCRYGGEPLDGVFLDIVKGQVAKTEADEAHYPYHSFWWIIRKADRMVVGSADFKGVPNADGEVEIGYGLGQAHRHKGYMTEAVHAMCRWALAQPGVTRVIAETERDNPPSQNVLKRCGFSLYEPGKPAAALWWRL